MYAIDLFKKNRRFFNEFPHLWAVVGYCHGHLTIEAHELDGEIVTRNRRPNTRWWVVLSKKNHHERVVAVVPFTDFNLAAEIIYTRDKFGTDMDALYLVSVETTQTSLKVMVHKPNRRAPNIMDVCRHRRNDLRHA